MKTNVREAGGVAVVELKGKITIGSGDVQLRETINKLVDSGKKNILVDMEEGRQDGKIVLVPDSVGSPDARSPDIQRNWPDGD